MWFYMNLSIVFAFDLIFKLLVGERDFKGVHQEPFDVYVGTSLIHSNPNVKPIGLGSSIYIIYSLSLLISQCTTQRSHMHSQEIYPYVTLRGGIGWLFAVWNAKLLREWKDWLAFQQTLLERIPLGYRIYSFTNSTSISQGQPCLFIWYISKLFELVS